MTFLVLSLLALVIGPAFAYWLEHKQAHHTVLKVLKLVAFFAVLGMVGFHLIPELYKHQSWIAISLLLVGFALPMITEWALHRLANRAHLITLVIALVGLVFHTFVDGSAVTEHMHEHSHGWFPLAVILHRLPVGLAVWVLVKEAFNIQIAFATLILMLLGTIGGFFYAESLAHLAHEPAFLAFQALAAGMLLHVVVHQPLFFKGRKHEHSH